jgi:hypothetical protein
MSAGPQDQNARFSPGPRPCRCASGSRHRLTRAQSPCRARSAAKPVIATHARRFRVASRPAAPALCPPLVVPMWAASAGGGGGGGRGGGGGGRGGGGGGIGSGGAGGQACKFWMQGNCIKGSACPYAHPAGGGGGRSGGGRSGGQAGSAWGTPAAPSGGHKGGGGGGGGVCKFWMQGHCNKGDTCSFAHPAGGGGGAGGRASSGGPFGGAMHATPPSSTWAAAGGAGWAGGGTAAAAPSVLARHAGGVGASRFAVPHVGARPFGAGAATVDEDPMNVVDGSVAGDDAMMAGMPPPPSIARAMSTTDADVSHGRLGGVGGPGAGAFPTGIAGRPVSRWTAARMGGGVGDAPFVGGGGSGGSGGGGGVHPGFRGLRGGPVAGPVRGGGPAPAHAGFTPVPQVAPGGVDPLFALLDAAAAPTQPPAPSAGAADSLAPSGASSHISPVVRVPSTAGTAPGAVESGAGGSHVLNLSCRPLPAAALAAYAGSGPFRLGAVPEWEPPLGGHVPAVA